MPSVARVTVYDANLANMFNGGGDAWNWLERVGHEHFRAAVVEAPTRTANLLKQHTFGMTPYAHGIGCRYTVGNEAPYSEYVHGGTVGPIRGEPGALDWGKGPIEGTWMFVRPAPFSFFPYGKWVNEVSGQTANPWIARAGAKVLGKYGFTGAAYPIVWY